MFTSGASGSVLCFLWLVAVSGLHLSWCVITTNLQETLNKKSKSGAVVPSAHDSLTYTQEHVELIVFLVRDAIHDRIFFSLSNLPSTFSEGCWKKFKGGKPQKMGTFKKGGSSGSGTGDSN